MSDFTDAPTSSVSDLSKRVRYSTGLVLGVDEFTQDQAYFMERDRLLTRALHGYGVVQGLDVNVIDPDVIDPNNEKVQIKVGPGLAVEQSGQHVCVERAQCAIIKDWLAQQAPKEVFSSSELGGTDGSNGGNSSPDEGPTKEVCLSVVLRYGTCATDFVPIPGEPCRSAEESRAASRLADDFSLALEFKKNRPPQVEEHAIRLLGRLLRALEIRSSEKTISVSTLEALVKSVPEVLVSVDDQNIVTVKDGVSIRALADAAGVTDADGVVLPDSEGDELHLRVSPGQEVKLLRAVEEVWTTHTRRALLEKGHGAQNSLKAGQGANGQCQPVPKGDDGVVLGTLCLTVTPKVKEDANGKETGLQPAAEEENDDGTLNTDKQEVKTEDRPRLLASRVLQETGFFNRSSGDLSDETLAGESAGGDLTGTYPDPRVDGLQGTPIADPDQYSPNEGTVLQLQDGEWRPVSAEELVDLDVEDTTLAGTEAGGDLAGTYPDPRVDGLQETSVAGMNPESIQNGDVLTWDATAKKWKPDTVTHPEAEVPEPTVQPNLTRIIATSWTHGQQHSARSALRITLARPNSDPQNVLALAVAFGRRGMEVDGTLGLGDPGRVERTVLRPEVFRAHLELEVNEFTGMGASGLASRVRLAPKAVFPLISVTVEETARGPEIVRGEIGVREQNTFARGVALVLPDSFDDVLPQVVNQRVEVDLRGEFIVDEDGRAVDGTFLDGQLPTGQRPNADGAGTLGVQGGRFESWFYAQFEETELVNLNTAGKEELMVLPNVGSVIADRIITYRSERDITDRIELTEVQGLTERQIQDWEGLATP